MEYQIDFIIFQDWEYHKFQCLKMCGAKFTPGVIAVTCLELGEACVDFVPLKQILTHIWEFKQGGRFY